MPPDKPDHISKVIAGAAVVISAATFFHSCHNSDKNEDRANRMEERAKDAEKRANRMEEVAATRDKISMLTRRTELMRILYERTPCDEGPCPHMNSVYMRSAALKEYIQVIRHLNENKYLAEVDMNGGRLAGIDMDGFEMSQCHFSDNSNFDSAEMPHMCVAYSGFSDGNFNSAHFNESGFETVDFSGAKLFETDFTKARLRNVDFTGAEFFRAIFKGSQFSYVDFTDVAGLTQDQLKGACRRGPVILPKGLKVKLCQGVKGGASEEMSGYEDPNFYVCPK